MSSSSNDLPTNSISFVIILKVMVLLHATNAAINNVSKRQVVKMSATFFLINLLPPFIILAKKQTSFRISKFYHSIYSSSIFFWRTKNTPCLPQSTIIYSSKKMLKTPKIVSSCVAGGARRRRKIACRHRICRCRYARVCSRFCKGHNICKPCIFRLFACFL